MSGRKWPADDTSVPVELLGKLLRSLEVELPRALELRERLHTIPEPSHGEHATSSLVAEAAHSLLTEAGFEPAPMRSCGSDDFGFYGRTSPTLMLFVRIKDGPDTPNVPLHHPRFFPPGESVGAVVRAQAVATSLGRVPLGSDGG